MGTSLGGCEQHCRRLSGEVRSVRHGDRVKAEQETVRHFLGAVVVQQVNTATRDVERREVIDGQQRLTTLQLLLDAVQYVCEKR